VQGILELQDTLAVQLPTQDDRDIDLSILTLALCAAEQVQASMLHCVLSSTSRRCLSM
jgi:hypothetical protein